MNEIFKKDYQRIIGDKENNKSSFLKNFIRYHEVRFMYFYRKNNRLFKRRYKLKYGNNVLIAPNSYVNCDIPSDSVVFGNPCIIKHNPNATFGYIINTI